MKEQTGRPFAVVTGASSGIGYELARQFAQHEYDLLVTAEEDAIEDAAHALRRDSRSRVTGCQVDLATFDGVETLYQAIQATGRPVDALALNAGRGVGGDFLDTELRAELTVIALNVASTVHLAKLVLPGMVARGAGRVLITSSVAATAPGPYFAVYGASKAFVQSFAQAIRLELANTGVTVTALMPGATDTRFFERAGMLDTAVGAAEKDDPALVAKQAFEALLHGDDHVVAGALRNRAAVLAGKVLPETTKAAHQAAQTAPGSAPHPG